MVFKRHYGTEMLKGNVLHDMDVLDTGPKNQVCSGAEGDAVEVVGRVGQCLSGLTGYQQFIDRAR